MFWKKVFSLLADFDISMEIPALEEQLKMSENWLFVPGLYLIYKYKSIAEKIWLVSTKINLICNNLN